MRLNLEECCVRVVSDDQKNKYGDWVVRVYCGVSLGGSIGDFKHGCDMVYRITTLSRQEAEERALRKFIVDRFIG